MLPRMLKSRMNDDVIIKLDLVKTILSRIARSPRSVPADERERVEDLLLEVAVQARTAQQALIACRNQMASVTLMRPSS